ncbi:MAG: hypothetical protein FWD14_08215 [Treponema sp.]|nr:hypothetical protein [Treponema sp.]
MDKKIYLFITIAGIILIGYLAYTYLEIYSYKKTIFQSDEAYNNNLLAMERWLKATGHTVRYDDNFYINKLKKTSEDVVILNSEMLFWEDTKEVISWIEQGGHLILCIHDQNINSELKNFLSDFGINFTKINTNVRQQENFYPAFDMDFTLLLDNEDGTFFIDEIDHIIRLAEIQIGKGFLTVTGRPLFMYNRNLQHKKNAEISWRLTGARAKENGVLIVYTPRVTHQRLSMFGAIAQRGSVTPIFISMVILIIAGFWSVIPRFGLVFADKQKTSRPIKDRFDAEIRFLKKYRALDYYLKVYEQEHKTDICNNEKQAYNYRELINIYRRLFYGTTKP